jgi:hypothetical protein
MIYIPEASVLSPWPRPLSRPDEPAAGSGFAVRLNGDTQARPPVSPALTIR